jgi:predicted CXXCH cytochrome family protein
MRMVALILLASLAAGQELDTVVSKGQRKAANILDQVDDPGERDLYLKIYRETTPLTRRSLATEFLRKYPASWLLPQVLEAAAKSSMEMEDFTTGLFYARQSLRLYPENPLLLVPVAIVRAKRGESKAAAETAQTALEYLAKFAAPAGVPERQWTSVHDSLRDTAEKVARKAIEVPLKGKPDAMSAYAGSAACERCHTAQFQAWQQTGMARMLRPFEAENVMGNFGGAEFAEPSGAARMSHTGDNYFFEMRRSTGQWDRYKIAFTIGSKWQQAYVTRAASGDLHVLPVQYNRLQKKWLNYWRLIDPENSERTDLGAFHQMSAVTSYQQNCAPCHTSQLREKGFAEPGINCEMCHGPSAAHAAGAAPGFQFQKVDNRAYVQVCAQCHAQSALRDPQAFPPRYERRPYTEFSRKAFYRDGRFRETTFVVESFERSACFRKGSAHCGSCHDPHSPDAASNPTSLKFRDNPDQMCLQCHPVKYAAVAHVKHPPANEGARCVSCHMPKIMNSLLFKARSHQIDDKPDAAMTERFGLRESPNACLLCHSEQSVAWTREQLRSW